MGKYNEIWILMIFPYSDAQNWPRKTVFYCKLQVSFARVSFSPGYEVVVDFFSVSFQCFLRVATMEPFQKMWWTKKTASDR